MQLSLHDIIFLCYKQSLQAYSKEDSRHILALVTYSDLLQLVHKLPAVLCSLRYIADELSYQYSRRTVGTTLIKNVLAEHSDLKPHFEKLMEVWNKLSAIEDGHLLSTDSPLQRFLIDRHTVTSSLPYRLVERLVGAHNGMVETNESQTEKPLSKVTEQDLVILKSEEEVLNLVSSYRESDGEPATYNWKDINKQVLVKYLSNKPKIVCLKDQLPFYQFSEDSDVALKLRSINDSQEVLEEQACSEILELLENCNISTRQEQRMQNLTFLLKELEIDYIRDTFKRDSPITITSSAKLKHVRHVWLLVKYEQTHQLLKSNHKVFDDVSLDCKVAFPRNLEAELHDEVHHKGSNTRRLMMLLFEYIVLGLNHEIVRERQDVSYPSQSLKDGLKTYLMSIHKKDLSDQVMNPDSVLQKLQVRHAAKTWINIWRKYTNFQ
ncbi:hypothetical protein EB796_003577 [Bugula neritina]|uniref:Uncharacterized protein n=1 Tax=Bugula neritina TaxID=10212 RepID=A0A7J7KJJ8_BUGNE|nr:hypothetical protein EB796_003577 [Bugula neritina]